MDVSSLTYTADVETTDRTLTVTIPAAGGLAPRDDPAPSQSTASRSGADEVRPTRLLQLLIATSESLRRPVVLASALLPPPNGATLTAGDHRGVLVAFSTSIFGVLPSLPPRPVTVSSLEFVFVVDKSGSMGHTSMEIAKAAVIAALRLLPTRATFNVMKFSSGHSSVFRRPSVVNDGAIAEAVAWVEAISSGGGTEIRGALAAVFDAAVPNGGVRNVLLLTDGQVSDEQAVVSLIADRCNDGSNRVFTFGIGGGVSTYIIVEGVRAGKGQHYFLAATATDSYLQEALEDTMSRAQQRGFVVSNLRIRAVNSTEDAPLWTRDDKATFFGNTVGAIFAVARDPAATAALCESSSARRQRIVGDVFAAPGGQQAPLDVPIPDGACAATATAPAALMQLAVKDVLTAWDRLSRHHPYANDAAFRQRIVDASVRYQVLSQHTALLAVETRASARRRSSATNATNQTDTNTTDADDDSLASYGSHAAASSATAPFVVLLFLATLL